MLQSALYGVKAPDAESASGEIGAALALPLRFENHRSPYLGDYCLYPPTKERRSLRGRIRVYRNHDPMHSPGSAPAEGQFFEPGFPDYGVLVYAYLAAGDQERFRRGLKAAYPDAILIRDATDTRPPAAADRAGD
jgi:hypothetical protein